MGDAGGTVRCMPMSLCRCCFIVLFERNFRRGAGIMIGAISGILLLVALPIW